VKSGLQAGNANHNRLAGFSERGMVMTRRPDTEMMLDLIPTDGTPVGNVTLIQKLGWKEEKYWRVRNTILEQGYLERGKGKGGSVKKPSQAGGPAARKSTYGSAEAQLYKPLLSVLANDWVQEMRMDPDQIVFEITAWKGKKPTGGTWTRPDITAVTVRSFQHFPGKYVDVWTFEVKSADSLDVTAIFEAAAHASRATRSYALLQVPERQTQEITDLIERCVQDAARLRVGLITFASPNDFNTWETQVEVPKLDTPPESLDEFIAHLSDDTKKRLAKMEVKERGGVRCFT
jgi:hypothetical protein